MFGTLISILLYWVVAALVIFIVGKLNLGLQVKSFGAALLAALVIALVAGVLGWVFSLFGFTLGTGLLAALINLVVAAIVLIISDKFLSGMEVHGFMGAIVAAIAIGAVGWVVTWLLSLFGIVL
jgi:putative membrane protein